MTNSIVEFADKKAHWIRFYFWAFAGALVIAALGLMFDFGLGMLALYLIAPVFILPIWLLPIYLVATEKRVPIWERTLWVLGTLFLSWLLWIVFFIFAPLSGEKPVPKPSVHGSSL